LVFFFFFFFYIYFVCQDCQRHHYLHF
jgi:hypothetical protein